MTIPENAIRNEAGQVAMKWIPNRPAQTLRMGDTNRYYVFAYAHHVPLIWADEQDVAALMAIRVKNCNCNNGTYINAVGLANQIDVNLHKCGNRNCEENK